MDWLKGLATSLPVFLSSIQIDNQTGRYLPCIKGATRLGKLVSLGYSCFALKLCKILNSWDNFPSEIQVQWIDFIRSFQVQGTPINSPFSKNAFLDQAVIILSHRYIQFPEQLLYHLNTYWKNPKQAVRQIINHSELGPIDRALIADTKQALATLAEVGFQSNYIYSGLPETSENILSHLKNLDWSNPWGAGGQAAALPVYIKTQCPLFMSQSEVSSLTRSCAFFFESIVDKQTGAFFVGKIPSYGNLINGAMKVLTALDWLENPIPYPKPLIDTCLSQPPTPDGCHLVDVIYVLYRCIAQTDYRKTDIQNYCRQVLESIKKHYNPDGGFSYYIGRSQTGYYGVRITHGLNESDLHGTILLTWAAQMILDILEANTFGWQTIKP